MTDAEQHFMDHLRPQLSDEYRRILKPYRATKYVDLLSSGRLLRSRLALKTAGGETPILLACCTALEMIHTSTLVHDDIVDKATMRRGHQTLSAGLGIDQALMIGNLISTRGLLIAEGSASPELFDHYLQTLDRINAAQAKELWHRTRVSTSINDSIEICAGKTSGMFEMAVRIGCSADAARDANVNLLTSIFTNFGIAYQIIDDVEDVKAWRETGNTSRSKEAQFDIELGNYTTAPVIFAAKALKSRRRRHSPDLNPHNFTAVDWEVGIERARKLASKYLADAQETTLTARRDGGPTSLVAGRLEEWLATASESLMHRSVDDTATTG